MHLKFEVFVMFVLSSRNNITVLLHQRDMYTEYYVRHAFFLYLLVL